jgi:tetratricopeptide (TPR) repeat protein
MSLQGLAHARKVGNRLWEWLFLGHVYPLYALGSWDEVLSRRDQLPHEEWTQSRIASGAVLRSAVPVCVHRGQIEEAKRMAGALAEMENSADVQERAFYGVAHAEILLAENDCAEALRVAESVFAEREPLGIDHDSVKEAFGLALQSALALGELDKADELLSIAEQLLPGRRPRFADATVARFRAQLAARGGNADEAERLFRDAGGLFQELGTSFYLAVMRLEHAEWLVSQGRAEEAEPLLAEASEIFSRLQAEPWRERLDRIQAGGRAEIPASVPT